MDGVRWNNLRPGTVARATRRTAISRKRVRDRLLFLMAVVPVLLAVDAAGAADDIGQTIRADDLPFEFEVLWRAGLGRDRQWTLVGENEKLYSAAEAVERLNRVAPQVRTEIIPGAGHDLTFVQTELVNRRIVEFLEDL